MKKILFCILILTALACNLIIPPVTSGPSTPVTDTPFCQPALSINEDVNGQTIYLNKGDFLRVELDANPSTGYEWLVDRIESEKLTDLGTEFSYGANPPPGSPGTQWLCFQAISIGTTTLWLNYHSVRDLNATPDTGGFPDFEITIVINE